MKNKIKEVTYFICFSILSGIFLPVYAQYDYHITASLSKNKYTYTEEIEALFQSNLTGFNKYITYTKVPRGLVLSIDSSIFFEQNDDIIKETSKEFLDLIGQTIKFIDKSCIIESNAKLSDNKNYTNWEITTTRAQNISEYLIKVHQLNPQKIRAIGFGSIMPETSTQRIDFVILNYEQGTGL